MKIIKTDELVFKNDLVFIEDSAEISLNEFFNKISIKTDSNYDNIPLVRKNIEGKTNNFIELVALINKQGRIISVEFTYNNSHLIGNIREASMNYALNETKTIKDLHENLLKQSRYGNHRYKQAAKEMRFGF